MLSINYRQLIVQIGTVLAVFILQVVIVYLNSNLRNQLARSMEFSSMTVALALLIVLIGTASGVILTFLLLPHKKVALENDSSVLKAIILGILPTLAIVAKLSFWAGAPILFPEYLLGVRQWAIDSEIPSLWLGLVIGWILLAAKFHK